MKKLVLFLSIGSALTLLAQDEGKNLFEVVLSAALASGAPIQAPAFVDIDQVVKNVWQEAATSLPANPQGQHLYDAFHAAWQKRLPSDLKAKGFAKESAKTKDLWVDAASKHNSKQSEVKAIK